MRDEHEREARLLPQGQKLLLHLDKLWKPELSVVLAAQLAFSGMERRPAGKAWRWVAQRWLCQPKSMADVLFELQAADARRPREIPSHRP
jgi:hypothetical protein